MKRRLFFLSILMFFLLVGCNKDKITLKIVQPANGAVFKTYEDIEVVVTASTKKGRIRQVILTVDTVSTYDKTQAPYEFLIPKNTFRKAGFYFLSVNAYSSEGVREGASINISIK